MKTSCTRKGSIWLYPKGPPAIGHYLVMPTTCKTYSCPSCQPGLLALFRARLEIGVSRLGRCAFITVTYKHIAKPTKGFPGTNRSRLNAPACEKDWKAFLRRMKAHGDLPGLWLKVIELTKAKVPHHHLAIGPAQGMISCHGRFDFDVKRHRKRMDTCGCLSHVWSRHWLEVTGDSYLVFATPVLSAHGAGFYLDKYMAKTHVQRKELEDRGFKRRWSSSRTWPGGGRLRLYQTTHGGWAHIHFTREQVSGPRTRRYNPVELLRRDGENLTLALAAKRSKTTALKRLEKFANVTLNRA